MPSKDLPDQNAANAEAKVSGATKTPSRTARGLFALVKTPRTRVILAIIGGITFLIFTVIMTWMVIGAKRNRPPEQLVAIDQVLQALDRRAFAEVQTLAKQLQTQGTLSAEEFGGPAFALGAAAAYEAENSSGKDRAKLFLLAARYLDEANRRGFPANRNAEGLFLLGKSMYESGQISASRSVLLSAMKISPQYRAEIHSILADSYLNDVNPKFEQALEQNAMLLADKNISQAKRQEGLIQRARFLLRLGKIDQCKATLDQISADEKNPSVAVERGQVFMYEARVLGKKTPATDDDQAKAREKLQAAIQLFQLVRKQETGDIQAARQAMYLTGICYLEMGDYRVASDEFTRTHGLFPDLPEGVAAGFQAGEIYRRLGRDIDALSEYRRALAAIADAESYNNPWISLDELKSLLMAAHQSYLSALKFEIALQFTRLMQHLFPVDQVLLLQAETHNLWGQTLTAQAEKGPRNKAEFIRRLGLEQFRRAGACYDKLAENLPANKMYTDQVWNSAMGYMQGQDFKNAARMFQVYLKNEVQRRHPQALAYLGESLLTLDQLDKALEMLKDCIDLYPRDVYSCRARLLASRVYEEKGDFQSAESLLSDNLNGDYLTPESKEWRDSLFRLGELLYADGRYAEALVRLEEVAKRYPDLPETVQARYLMANCYYKTAVAIQDKINKASTGNSSDLLAKQIQELYSKALDQYKLVQETLGKDRDKMELTALQKPILRNCYFVIGDVLFAKGDYEAAVNAYSTAVNRYQGNPETLNAYVQIAGAYRRLNKPQEANNALQQAKFALNRMKSDAAFEETTNYNRKQWTERLDLLSSL